MPVHLGVFSGWKTCPVAWKSIAKAPNQKVARLPKYFSFFFFFFTWASSKLGGSFTMVSHKPATFHTEQCTSPSPFHNFEVSRGTL